MSREGHALVWVYEGESGISWETGSCKDVSKHRNLSTKGWSCLHTGRAAQTGGAGKGAGGGTATVPQGATEEQTAIQTRPRGFSSVTNLVAKVPGPAS